MYLWYSGYIAPGLFENLLYEEPQFIQISYFLLVAAPGVLNPNEVPG